MTVGPLEILVLLILVLLVAGGRWLPGAGRAVGGGIRSLIDGARGLHPADEKPKQPPELEERAPGENPPAS
jgi:sec-independent protein translocase protein TatA